MYDLVVCSNTDNIFLSSFPSSPRRSVTVVRIGGKIFISPNCQRSNDVASVAAWRSIFSIPEQSSSNSGECVLRVKLRRMCFARQTPANVFCASNSGECVLRVKLRRICFARRLKLIWFAPIFVASVCGEVFDCIPIESCPEFVRCIRGRGTHI
jgi:hypothetical protein